MERGVQKPTIELVMAGLAPAIHVLRTNLKEDVDARHKAGHDEGRNE